MKRVIGLTVHYDDGTTLKVPADGIRIVVGGAQHASRYEYINADECPVHGPWRAVPGGERDGRRWDAFWACDVPRGDPRCTYRPHKDWVETHPPERAVPRRTESFDDLPF